MGCGGTKSLFREQLIKDKELFREAFTSMLKKDEGFEIDKSKIETHKVLNEANPIFKEELMDHADESGNVKQWLANIVPPEWEVIENKEEPKVTLKVEHVFGFRSYDVRQNLYFVDNEHIAYMSGALGIIQNINNYSQKIFGGLEYDDEGACHDDDIVSIAFFRGDVSMIATGQRKSKPMIHVWSPLDPSCVYSTFYQKKGSKEVSSLSFDRRGEYIGSVGRDANNSFYLFNIQRKTLQWFSSTGPNILFDLQFSPKINEFVLVGIKSILFCNYHNKTITNPLTNNKVLADLTFTAACYTSQGFCITSTTIGSLFVWESGTVVKEVKVSLDTIQNLSFSDITGPEKVYVTDSSMNVYIYTFDKEKYSEVCKLAEKFQVPAIAKALDVNENGDIVLGLKDGTIMLKNTGNKTEKIICRSHFDGNLTGMFFISDRYLLTSGEDNRVMLWNINSKFCEAMGTLNKVEKSDSEMINFLNKKSEFNPSQCSRTISYNIRLDHVAIGLNNGYVSIRAGLRKLDDKVIPDVQVSIREIEELKYSPDYRFLGVSSVDLDFVILNPYQQYAIMYKLKGHESYITQFDWDISCRYIQAVTINNEYLFYNVTKQELITGN